MTRNWLSNQNAFSAHDITKVGHVKGCTLQEKNFFWELTSASLKCERDDSHKVLS